MVNKNYSRKTLDLRQAIQPSPAIVSVSSQRVTRSSNLLSKESRGIVHYGNNFVNNKVNDYFRNSMNEHAPTREGLDPLIKKLGDSFKWYPPNKEIGSGSVPKPEKILQKLQQCGTTAMVQNGING